VKNPVTILLIALLSLSSIACGADSSHVKPAINKPKQTKTTVKKSTSKVDTLKPQVVKLPKLVDLGAGKCIPCKMMAPILEELKADYSGKLEVVFIDVWKNSEEGDKYKIKLIPTQIFFDSTGKEKFRHEGFYSREDIMAKWKELGYEFKKEDK